MDGISPTLALAVLLFGASDNAHGTASQASETAAQDRSGCPVLLLTGDPAQLAAPGTWSNEAFWISAPDALALPNVIDPTWTDAERSGDLGSAALLQPDDPIVRHLVPVATIG